MNLQEKKIPLFIQTLLFSFFVFLSSDVMAQRELLLLPQPQEIKCMEGYFRCQGHVAVFRGVNKKDRTELLPFVQEVFPSVSTSTSRGPAIGTILLQIHGGRPSLSDESYRLEITPKGAVLTASATAGLFYGLQTLRQLRAGDSIPCLTIEDSPRYPWRGVMIDVSRHFRDIRFLKRQIDLLARYKVNRLHLHLTDQAGWRMEVKSYPRLTSLAAWRPQREHKDWSAAGKRYVEEDSPSAQGGYYTQEQLRDLVRYALRRHITIIPEIEMPAHSRETLTAYPELSCSGEPYRDDDLCPANPETYRFVSRVLGEVSRVFPSEYLHIGGDEAGKQAWRTCPKCQALMKKEGLSNVDELQNYFIHRVSDIVSHLGRKMLGWDEIMDGGTLPAGTGVMVWHDLDVAQKAIDEGYSVVLSPGRWCYLDAAQDAPHTQPEAFGGYRPLSQVYSFDPSSVKDTRGCVIGVQANLWTEMVPTADHAEWMLYPRSLAIAEIGWHPEGRRDFASFRRAAVRAVGDMQEEGYHPFDLKKEVGSKPASHLPLQAPSVGKSVKYAKSWSPYYPANGDKTLTDGLKGDWHFGDGRWQGFIGQSPMDVTIDLGKTRNITSVMAEFTQQLSAEIYFPARLYIAVSEDGVHFTDLFQEKYPSTTEPMAYRDFGWTGQSRARYVRYHAFSGERGGWLFTDEVVIK